MRLALYAAALLMLFGVYRLVAHWYEKREPKSIDSDENQVNFIDSGSTNVADISKHIADFEDESAKGMVQARAMYALIKIGEPAVHPLIEALESGDLNTRLMAVNTLGLLGAKAKEALPALQKRLGDTDTDVQARAHDALQKIGE